MRLDLKMTQGAPAFTAANVQVWWASQNDSSETPVYYSDPNGPYEHLYPSDQWTIECIQGTHDKLKKYFHVKIAITSPEGYPLGETHRFIPLEESFAFCQTWYLFPALAVP